MKGNILFELKKYEVLLMKQLMMDNCAHWIYRALVNFSFFVSSGHQGHVTGCVHSNFSNLVVTSGSDCTGISS